MTVRRFVSNSSRETIAIGGEIAHMLSSPALLFLRGDLGAGKTTLVKGIAQALDAADPDEVTSPTFTLVHEYDGRRTVGGKDHDIKLYHIDLYRIEDERQLETIGFDEMTAEDAILLGGAPLAGLGVKMAKETGLTVLDGVEASVTAALQISGRGS